MNEVEKRQTREMLSRLSDKKLAELAAYSEDMVLETKDELSRRKLDALQPKGDEVIN